MLNRVSCLPTLNTELGFLFAYYDYWTGFPVFLFTYLENELSFLSTYFKTEPAFHLPWILNKVSCPPALKIGSGFLSIYLSTLLVHLPWMLNRVSCLPTLNIELGFLFSYYDYRTGFPVFLFTYLEHELSFLYTYFETEPAFHLP